MVDAKHEGIQDLSMLGGGEGFHESHFDRLQSDLQGWREVLIPVAEFLKWERPYYPAITVASTSIIFLLIWYVELSALTSASLALMLVGLVDFVVPFFGPSLTGYNTWTEFEEEKFSAICQQISFLYDDFLGAVYCLSDMRQKNAKLFFILVMSFFSFTAWLGYHIDNLLLLYLIVTFMLLLPGLRHHGVIDRIVCPLIGIINKIKSGSTKNKVA